METVCCWPSPLDKRNPRNGYVMSTIVDGVYMRSWQDIILYILYITGNAELPNINVPYTLRVRFTQTNSFVSGETKALVIMISFIYSTNIQA